MIVIPYTAPISSFDDENKRFIVHIITQNRAMRALHCWMATVSLISIWEIWTRDGLHVRTCCLLASLIVHYAVHYNQPEVLKAICRVTAKHGEKSKQDDKINVIWVDKAQADPSIQSKSLVTPLHMAVRAGNREMVQLLLELKADVNKQDDKVNDDDLWCMTPGWRTCTLCCA